jgi:hypothetical protein
MRSDRPLIASAISLTAGLSLIFGYCHGTAGFSAALPLSGSSLQLNTTTTGPAAVGGVALTGVGLLLLILALLAAIVGQIGLLAGKSREPKKIAPSEKPPD